MTRPRLGRFVAVLTIALSLGACASSKAPAPSVPAGAPKFPQYPTPDVPVSLRATPEIQAAQTKAWGLLQTGDLRGAEKEFTTIVRDQPAFYPGETGLGFALLAEKQYKPAASHFAGALAKNDRYIPALQGLASSQLAQDDQAGAIASFERILAIDPKQDAVRSRLDLLRFRQVQSYIDAGRKARDAGHLDDAQTSFEHALTLSPSSAVIYRELALVDLARNTPDQAETHARRAVQLDAGDPEGFATLGVVLEAKGKYREAAAAYASAVKLDPRPAWKMKSDALAEKADMAGVPADFRTIDSATTVNRAQLAALIGMRLEPVLAKASQHVTTVATDIQGHWAEPWILPVTQAGVMDVYPNHTFQPSGTVRRTDLARVVSQMLTLIAAERNTDLTRWRASRPAFPDLPPTNVYYGSAALAVAAGAMTAVDGARFAPTTPATGATVVAAVTRLQQIAGREP